MTRLAPHRCLPPTSGESTKRGAPARMILFFESQGCPHIVSSFPELDQMAPIQVENHEIPTYPPERIPKHAILSAASLLSRSSCDIPAIDDAGEVRYANRGCMAIGLALDLAG